MLLKILALYIRIIFKVALKYRKPDERKRYKNFEINGIVFIFMD